jgi:hypothetical protein
MAHPKVQRVRNSLGIADYLPCEKLASSNLVGMKEQSRETPGGGGDMYLPTDLAPEIRLLASEVYNRSWQFLERDPLLAGEDKDNLQERLAELILLLMKEGERNIIAIANKAIAALREQCAMQSDNMLLAGLPD